MFGVTVHAPMLLFFAVSTCTGTVLFSNLVEPGGMYGPDDISLGDSSGSHPLEPPRAVALRFSVEANAFLESFEVPLDWRRGPNKLTAFLLRDAAGTPGEIIESYPLVDLPDAFPAPLETIDSMSHVTLLSAQNYWFAVSAGGATFGGWALTLYRGNPLASSNMAVGGVVGDPASTWWIGPGGSDAREPVLIVNGEIVPEPGTLILGFSSLVTFLIRCRPKSRRTSE